MKNIKFGQDGKKNKGFLIALGLSVVAVGVAGAVAIGSAVRQFEDDQDYTGQLTSNNATSSSWGFASDDEVNKAQSDVPKSSSSVPATSSKPQTSSQASSTTTTDIKFIMPISGEVVNPYSNGELVKSETLNTWKAHTGADIKGNITDPVKASGDGKVSEIKEDPLWGVVVTIDHANGYQSIYANLTTAVTVKKDQSVKQGDVIGSIGETAQIESKEVPHLHFAMKKDGKYIDPIAMTQKK